MFRVELRENKITKKSDMKRKPITLKRIFLETRSKLKYQRKYI